MAGQFGGNYGEMVLCGLDEDVEEKNDEDGEGRDSERWVFAEEAGVVEERNGAGFGARWACFVQE